MKNIIFGIIALILIIVGVTYAMKHRTVAPTGSATATTTAHINTASGVVFIYPTILTVTDSGATTTLHHEVPFEHHDYCDFKGDQPAPPASPRVLGSGLGSGGLAGGNTTIPTLTDFHLTTKVVPRGLIPTMKTESPYIPEENFKNNVVVPSPGFIDPVTFGTLSGFAIFEGAEGCGQVTYYFPITITKTLVAKQQFITIFSGAIDAAEGEKALKVPGVISKEREGEILQEIFSSLKVQ